jgi:hypothetical protein
MLRWVTIVQHAQMLARFAIVHLTEQIYMRADPGNVIA